jgi:hypothetical protein
MNCCSSLFFFEKKQQTTRRLFSAEFSCQKNRVPGFLVKKIIFNFFLSKTLRKYHKHLDKPIHYIKKNDSKNQNQLEPEDILVIRSASLNKDKKKKHLGKIPLIKKNSLTPISTILVVGIVINGD